MPCTRLPYDHRQGCQSEMFIIEEYVAMESILDLSTSLGHFIISHLPPRSFRHLIEADSDLATALGGFVIAAAITVLAWLI